MVRKPRRGAARTILRTAAPANRSEQSFFRPFLAPNHLIHSSRTAVKCSRLEPQPQEIERSRDQEIKRNRTRSLCPNSCPKLQTVFSSVSVFGFWVSIAFLILPRMHWRVGSAAPPHLAFRIPSFIGHGTRAKTVVPAPRRDSMDNFPFTKWSLSCILISPTPLRLTASCKSKPNP